MELVSPLESMVFLCLSETQTFFSFFLINLNWFRTKYLLKVRFVLKRQLVCF